MEKREYDEPPLIEAACEFRFPPDSDWDNTIPGRLYERIEQKFPNKRSGKHVNIRLGIEEEQFHPSFDARDRTIFSNEEETQVVQLLPRVLTVHRLPPYTSWDAFQPLVIEVLGACFDLVDVERLHRASVRYRNHIEFPNEISIEDYFDFYPYLGENFPQGVGAFISGVEFPRNDDGLLRVELTSVAPEEDDTNLAVRLDLTCARLKALDVETMGDVETWLDGAHDDIEDFFEGAIRDPLRENFGVPEAT